MICQYLRSNLYNRSSVVSALNLEKEHKSTEKKNMSIRPTKKSLRIKGLSGSMWWLCGQVPVGNEVYLCIVCERCELKSSMLSFVLSTFNAFCCTSTSMITNSTVFSFITQFCYSSHHITIILSHFVILNHKSPLASKKHCTVGQQPPQNQSAMPGYERSDILPSFRKTLNRL